MYDKVIIIAGGESFKKCDGLTVCSKGFTIGVNDSAVHAPVDIGVSMDRRWTEYRVNEIRNTPFWLRKAPEKWVDQWMFKCDETTNEFSEIPGNLNGKNSGYCALNLAYHMRPKKLYLFGFDMQGTYWYEPYPWVKYKHRSRILPEWIEAFETAKKYFDSIGTEVFIIGDTKIECFKKMTYQDFLKS